MTVGVSLRQSAVITLLQVQRAARHSLPWLDHPFRVHLQQPVPVSGEKTPLLLGSEPRGTGVMF